MDETEQTGVAFRAGIRGLPFVDTIGAQPDITVQSDTEQGPNELYLVATLDRLPALSDPEAAYETGRALRWIGFELDQQKMSVEQAAGPFVPQLANALVYFKMRNERQPWGAADTAFIFAELLISSGTSKPSAQGVEQAIILYAKQRPLIGVRSR